MFTFDTVALFGLAFFTLYSGFLIISRVLSADAVRGSQRIPGIQLNWQFNQWLGALDLNYQSAIFMVGIMMVSVMAALLFLEIFPSQTKAAIVAALLSGVMCVCFLKDFSDRRTARIETELAQAASVMSSIAANNNSLTDVMRKTAVILKRRVANYIVLIAANIERGMDAEKACQFLKTKYRGDGVNTFCDMIITSASTDIPLSKGLVVGQKVLNDKEKIRQSVRAHMSGVQYSSLFAGLLPYVLVPVMNWKEPGWLLTLAEHPNGAMILLGAIACQAFGFLWMRQLCSGKV